MSAFRKFRYYLYIGLTIVGTIAMIGFVIYEATKTPDKTDKTIGVRSETTDYYEATNASMDLLNGLVGCEFLVDGNDAVVKPTDGEPCGATFHPENRTGEHSAEAYECPGKTPRFEVHVSYPGNIHTQLCIVSHELLHVAGLPDRPGKGGIMGMKTCPRHVLLSDWETKTLREMYCQ